MPSNLSGLSVLSLILMRKNTSLWNVFKYLIVACWLTSTDSRFPSLADASKLTGNDTDFLALLAIKANIIDPFQVLSSWNGSIHFCEWYGVKCGRRHQRVTNLDLASNKLSGFITPHIGNLSFLIVLHLENNSFVHEIPPELGHLRRLKYLTLDNNSFTGKIPLNLSACSNLISISFSFNRLVGEIPAQLGLLSKMQFIYIDHNHLTGPIPQTFTNRTSLQVFYVPYNNLSGSIPNVFGEMTNLTGLSLAHNNLSGIIPYSVFNLTSLQNLDVSFNNIHGSLPSDIGITLPNLHFFGIGYNQFTGSIPNSISNALNLVVFEIANNNFNGKVPAMEKLSNLRIVQLGGNSLGSGGPDDLDFISSFTNATRLIYLFLGDNKFGGAFPESVSNLSTKLEMIDLQYNYVVGSIPAGITNLVSLNWLSMPGNKLTGNLLANIGKLHNLNLLDFGGNKLNGFLPSSLGNLSLLTELFLYGNNFERNIPPSLGKCDNLMILMLDNNNLSGTIPIEVIGLSSLSLALNLSTNYLTGSIPMEVGSLINLSDLDVSENILSGEIPSTLGSCVMLGNLYMQGNSFQGSLPSSLHSLRGIQELDLSHNNFSGKIPEYLVGLQLKKLNLSFNEFEGEVPIEGIFKNASAISVVGNNKLCGGILDLHLPRCNFTGSRKRWLISKLRLLIPFLCGLIGIILVVCFLCLYCFRKSREESTSSLVNKSHFRVSYQSLLKGTNGFSSENLIGIGSFGSVYKGILEDDGSIVAVKVLSLARRGAFKSFLAECEVLKNIRHRNLVKVLTACLGADYQGNDFMAIVYEFMVNGNLDEWLHPIQAQYDETEEPRSLSLLQRLNICIDVANALAYLHHACQNPIIHCDLKPSNILLNKEMTAHVGDFGLARFLQNDNYRNSGHETSSSVGIRGSIGYTAPEYGIGSEVSTSGDVYSYGILMLETFTGKRPTDQMFHDGLNLHNYVKTALPEKVTNIVDPTLLQHKKESQGHSPPRNFKIHKWLIFIFEIGLACSVETSSERLDISEALAKLKIVRDEFTGTGGKQRELHLEATNR